MSKTTTTTSQRKRKPRKPAPAPIVEDSTADVETDASDPTTILADVLTMADRADADAAAMMADAIGAHAAITLASDRSTMMAYCAEGAAIAVGLIQSGRERGKLPSASQSDCDEMARKLGAQWSKGEGKIRLRAYLYVTPRLDDLTAALASNDDNVRPASRRVTDLIQWCQARDPEGVTRMRVTRNGQRVKRDEFTADDRKRAAEQTTAAVAKASAEQTTAQRDAERKTRDEVRETWTKRVKRGGNTKHGGLVSMADVKRADAATLAATIAACEAAQRILSS